MFRPDEKPTGLVLNMLEKAAEVLGEIRAAVELLQSVDQAAEVLGLKDQAAEVLGLVEKCATILVLVHKAAVILTYVMEGGNNPKLLKEAIDGLREGKSTAEIFGYDPKKGTRNGK